MVLFCGILYAETEPSGYVTRMDREQLDSKSMGIGASDWALLLVRKVFRRRVAFGFMGDEGLEYVLLRFKVATEVAVSLRSKGGRARCLDLNSAESTSASGSGSGGSVFESGGGDSAFGSGSGGSALESDNGGDSAFGSGSGGSAFGSGSENLEEVRGGGVDTLLLRIFFLLSKRIGSGSWARDKPFLRIS